MTTDLEIGLAPGVLARLDQILSAVTTAGFAQRPRLVDDDPLWLIRCWTGDVADFVLLDGPHDAVVVRVAEYPALCPPQGPVPLLWSFPGEPLDVLEAAARLGKPTPTSSRVSVSRLAPAPRPTFSTAAPSPCSANSSFVDSQKDQRESS